MKTKKNIIIIIFSIVTVILLSAGIVVTSFSSKTTMSFKQLFANSINIIKGEGFWGYDIDCINAMLELSKNKTVKNDIVNTVTDVELEKAFGFEGYKTKAERAPEMNNVPDDDYSHIMLVEYNEFLKKNSFGELYTVFKTKGGAYIYGIMRVTPTKDNCEDIRFDRGYWVYDKVLQKSDFDNVVIGKTTRKEVYDFTGIARMQKEVQDERGVKSADSNLEDWLKELGYEQGQEVIEGSDISNVLKLLRRPVTHHVLTTTGVMTVTFEYDETLGEHVVSAMEFTEGCPVNPEDLI